MINPPTRNIPKLTAKLSVCPATISMRTRPATNATLSIQRSDDSALLLRRSETTMAANTVVSMLRGHARDEPSRRIRKWPGVDLGAKGKGAVWLLFFFVDVFIRGKKYWGIQMALSADEKFLWIAKDAARAFSRCDKLTSGGFSVDLLSICRWRFTTSRQTNRAEITTAATTKNTRHADSLRTFFDSQVLILPRPSSSDTILNEFTSLGAPPNDVTVARRGS